jgi:hypothetical protein
MSSKKGLGDRLAWLGGANKDVLDQVPTERARFIQMALVLLTTSSIAVMSMMFALNDGVHVAFVAAVIGGIFWGFVILNLDRFLVLSMGHTRDWKRLLLMALPRLLLAMVISLVIATPMTLRIFQHDINNAMVAAQATESKQDTKLIQQSGPAIEASQVLAKINTDKAIQEGHLQGTVTSPAVTDAQTQVNTLTPQVAQAQTAMDKAQAAYQCEIDGSGVGCEGASNLAGDGPMAHLKEAEFQQAQTKYNSLNSQLQAAHQSLNTAEKSAEQNQGLTLAQQKAAATQALPGLQAQYNKLEAQVTANETNAQNAVQNNNGILAQLQALSTAGAQNPMLGVAQWVVTLLFFFIEILPVLVKVMLNIGPLSPYEKVLKAEEDIVADRAKLKRVTKRRDSERAAEKDIAVDEDMRKREEALGIRANKFVADHMEVILDAALAEWSRRAQSQLNVQLPPGTFPPGTAPANGGPRGRGGRGLTSPQARLGITGPQAALNATGPQPTVNGANGGSRAYGANGNGWGANGNGWSNGNAPTVTRITPPGVGYSLPDDDGDVL